MLDENTVKDLLRLVEIGIIAAADIKDLNYKVEVESRLNTA